MSDVSAVVLTLGEPGTEEAIASLRRQTVPPAEVIVVRGVSPFHEAINAGARQVATPFFVQVDSDMVLDPDCLAELRRLARPDSGIVVGQLRDPLIGRVVGVKLFRTAPFRELLMGDTISPDTDLGNGLRRKGWETLYVGRPPEHDPEAWRTYGEHRPGYAPEYTFGKYLLEGRRYRYRDNPDGIRWHFGRLEASRHPSADVAQIALANGIFLESERDLLGRGGPDESYQRLASFLASLDQAPPDAAPGPDAGAPLRERFARYFLRGSELFHAGHSAGFRRLLAGLTGCHKHDAALVAKVGLCRGLLASDTDPAVVDADFSLLREFLDSSPAAGAAGVLRGLTGRLRRWLRLAP